MFFKETQFPYKSSLVLSYKKELGSGATPHKYPQTKNLRSDFLEIYIFLIAVVFISCICSTKLSSIIGVPTLLIFIVIGMILSYVKIFGIEFNNFNAAKDICTFALLFIMFYGGFGTNWNTAKPIAPKAILLSTLGVIITALTVGLFCHYIMGMNFLEGMLFGSVISSTDAASVFAILRGKRLNLSHGLAPILEIESGSNDPVSYMLVIIMLTLMGNGDSNTSILYLVFAQIIFGLLGGFLIGSLGVIGLRKIRFEGTELHSIFVLAIAMIGYAAPTILGGNGFLSVYIAGIILGNSKIHRKPELVLFFDGITEIMEMFLFFILGFLSTPKSIPSVIIPSIFIALFLTLVARPVAVATILTPFKVPFKHQMLVSWAGLRGAASIVFAIYAVISAANLDVDIFHIVFCIALLSVLFQGALLPMVARKLQLVDDSDNIFKTFNDYQEENSAIKLIEINIPKNHEWNNKFLKDIKLPPGMLAVSIARGKRNIVPRGDTILLENDTIIFCCTNHFNDDSVKLTEIKVGSSKMWINKTLNELHFPKDTLVVMIKRNNDTIIPKGDTYIQKNDTLVVYGELVNENL